MNRSLVDISKRNRIVERPDSETSASFRWHPELYRFLSFGHVPSSVDWLLIRFLLDTNLTKVKNDQETEVFRILNLATELDPAFISFYTGGSNYLAVARDDRVGALKLIEKGERFLRGPLQTDYTEAFRSEHWANSWRIYLIKGYLYLLEFRDPKRAAEAYSHMAEYPDAPEALKILSRSNRNPEAQFNLAANALNILKSWHEDDPDFQRDVRRRQDILFTARDLVAMNRRFAEFLGPRRPTSSEFDRFQAREGLPAKDRLGGEYYLGAAGKIETRTPDIPTLGADVDAFLKPSR